MKRKLIIISSFIIIAIVVIIGGYFFFNQLNSKNHISNGSTKNASNSYHVEKGLENMAKITKSAVESYANQNVSESTVSRNKRLGVYFVPGSAVFSRALDLHSNIIKTTAKITSITTYVASESEYPFLIVDTKMTYYTKNSSSMAVQTYWITIRDDKSSSFVADDIGIWVK